MRRWATILALGAVLVVLLPIGRGKAVAATDSHVQIVNLSDHNFGIAWYTDQPVTGSMVYGTTCATATAPGQPEATSDGYVHLVTASVGGLDAGTTYYFKLLDGGIPDDNGGQCYTARTFPQNDNLGLPTTVVANVQAPSSCAGPAPGALVVLTVTDNGTTSLPLAGLTDSGGQANIVIGTATSQSGALVNAATGDTLVVTGAGGPGNEASRSITYNPPDYSPQHLDPVCLPQSTVLAGSTPVTTDTAVPTPTSTAISQFFTATPTPTGTTVSFFPTPTPITDVVLSTSIPIATSQGFPSPLPTSLPLSPQATPTPTLGAGSVPPSPSATQTPTPSAGTSAGKIPLRVALTHRQVQRGNTQGFIVHTVPGAKIELNVTYPNHGGIFRSRGTANQNGYWQRFWHVFTIKTGKAAAQLIARDGTRFRQFYRYFSIK